MGIERRTVLLTINHYVKAKTLEEAYELNQARNARIGSDNYRYIGPGAGSD